MRHRLPAVLATLVVLATLSTGVSAGPAATGSPGAVAPTESGASLPVVSVSNTTGYLALPNGETDEQRDRFGTANVDVAGAAAMESSRFRIRLFRRSTIEAFRSAPNTSARTRVLRDAASDLENRSQALREQQSVALRAYNDGEISTETMLRRLAIVDARADRLDAAVTQLLQTVGTEPGYTLPTDLRIRIQNSRAEPVVMQGLVKSTIGNSVSGSGPQQVYVGNTDESLVLARIGGGRYVREAYVASAQGGPGPDRFRASEQYPVSAALERAQVLYPWAFDNRISTRRARGIGLTPIYRFTIDHSHGQLDIYLDGRTNQTFREIQDERISRLPVGETVTRETENLTIRANTTHPTGPMEVTVRDPELNATVDARISIDGTPVGRTGSDGSLWTIRPNGLPVINASTADHSAELTVGA